VNKKRFGDYLEVFTDIGMDLHLAGHLHYYERTHTLCWDKIKLEETIKKNDTLQNDTPVYHTDCPIYIIEGAAGNDYFEEE
jgi:hypothetical protein